jgi:hypothetical protein
MAQERVKAILAGKPLDQETPERKKVPATDRTAMALSQALGRGKAQDMVPVRDRRKELGKEPVRATIDQCRESRCQRTANLESWSWVPRWTNSFQRRPLYGKAGWPTRFIFT